MCLMGDLGVENRSFLEVAIHQSNPLTHKHSNICIMTGMVFRHVAGCIQLI